MCSDFFRSDSPELDLELDSDLDFDLGEGRRKIGGRSAESETTRETMPGRVEGTGEEEEVQRNPREQERETETREVESQTNPTCVCHHGLAKSDSEELFSIRTEPI